MGIIILLGIIFIIVVFLNMKTFDREYEIRRRYGCYTVWQRDKSLFGWGRWWCWSETTTLCGGFETYVEILYETLAKAERAIPRGGKIVRKPIK